MKSTTTPDRDVGSSESSAFQDVRKLAETERDLYAADLAAKKYWQGYIDGLDRFAGEHRANEKLIEELQSGERVILPKTKAHAQGMLRVAFAVLESLESSPNDKAEEQR